MSLTPELRHKMNQHAAKGGKTSRRRQIQRAEQFLSWCGCSPYEIGRRHVRLYFLDKKFAPTTARDHWYGIRLLWHAIGRASDPPRPL